MGREKIVEVETAELYKGSTAWTRSRGTSSPARPRLKQTRTVPELLKTTGSLSTPSRQRKLRRSVRRDAERSKKGSKKLRTLRSSARWKKGRIEETRRRLSPRSNN